MERLNRRVGFLLAVLSLAVCPSAWADHDLWYVLMFNGQRAGWQHTAQETAGDRITSTDEVRMQTLRDGEKVEIVMVSTFVENGSGEPVSMEHTQQWGAMEQTSRYVFEGDTVRITRNGPTGRQKETAARPDGSWLTPSGAQRFIEQRLGAGAETIRFAMLDPEQGLRPVVVTYEVKGRETVQALGKSVPAIRCAVTFSHMSAMTATEYLDERGLSIRSELGPISVVAAEKELALSDLDPPELMNSTLVKPDRPIDAPRRTVRGVYLLRMESGRMPDLPAWGTQRAERIDESRVRVVIDRTAGAPADDAGDERYMSASEMVASDDERIIALAERALRGVGEDRGARAEALRRFVHTYIHAKSLGVGFASASEVARTREGDCSEHATLLAALLRADGIPSRVVSGLVYVDRFGGQEDVFGYHMWTQAPVEIDGQVRWVDLDPTLPDDTPFDATHIGLAVSALADGELTNDLVALVPLLGELAISVESVE